MAIPPIPSSYAAGRYRTITCLGDSLTHQFSLGTALGRMWPTLLGDRLRAAGYPVRVRNRAISGATTASTGTGMLARVAEALLPETPDIVIIGTAANDAGGGISEAQSQANIQSMIRYLRNGCSGFVSGQADLPSGKLEGTRYLVLSDTSNTGGVATPTGSSPGPSRLGGTLTGPQVWYCRNGQGGVSGWSRVSQLTDSTRTVRRFLLWSPFFMNLSSGGDPDPASNSGHTNQLAAYLQAHNAMSAAVTAENAVISDCVYWDAYATFRQRIVDGKDTYQSASWHCANTDIHPNAHGNHLLSEGMYAQITAVAEWLTALQAT